jgi:hypothetical protein
MKIRLPFLGLEPTHRRGERVMSGMLREILAGTCALALTAGALVAASAPAAAAITHPDHPLVDNLPPSNVIHFCAEGSYPRSGR